MSRKTSRNHRIRKFWSTVQIIALLGVFALAVTIYLRYSEEQKAQAAVSAQKVMQIPSMTRRIEEEAFMGIAAEQINVPGNTVYIGNNAFADCDDLLLVVIPASVTTIDGNPFTGSDIAVICPDNCPAAIWCDRHGVPHNP